MYQFIDYEKNLNEHLAVITMNRPEVLNAMNPASTKEMTTIWDDFANDPEMWVAILTGAGDRAFTVGNDLKDTSSDTWPPKRDPSGWGGLVNRFDLSKPVIAAVHGFCLAGGTDFPGPINVKCVSRINLFVFVCSGAARAGSLSDRKGTGYWTFRIDLRESPSS